MNQAKQRTDTPPPRHTFPRAHRVRTPAEYAAVYDAKVRESRGPLAVYALPNGLPHLRLGLSVSRRVGIAVQRNRIRRLLREAYRLMQHDLAGGYDLVIVVRPHVPMKLEDYQRLLLETITGLDQKYRRRSAESATAPTAQAIVPRAEP